MDRVGGRPYQNFASLTEKLVYSILVFLTFAQDFSKSLVSKSLIGNPNILQIQDSGTQNMDISFCVPES